ncbi:hypothetical protein C0992_008954, partial [Termitomyces sp. T32_za158]
PPSVGAAVQRVKGKGKITLEPQTHTAQRARLEQNLEAFINLKALEGKDPDPRFIRFAAAFLHPISDCSNDSPLARPSSRASSSLSIHSNVSSTASTIFAPLKGFRPISKDEKDYLTNLLSNWRREQHQIQGSSVFLSPEILLPPKLLNKLVTKSGQFLKEEVVGRKEILKAVGAWDLANEQDFKDVGKIIDDWRRTILASDSPTSSQKRSHKKNRAHENSQPVLEHIPQPVFMSGATTSTPQPHSYSHHSSLLLSNLSPQEIDVFQVLQSPAPPTPAPPTIHSQEPPITPQQVTPSQSGAQVIVPSVSMIPPLYYSPYGYTYPLPYSYSPYPSYPATPYTPAPFLAHNSFANYHYSSHSNS